MALLHDYGVTAQKGEKWWFCPTQLCYFGCQTAIKPIVKHSIRNTLLICERNVEKE